MSSVHKDNKLSKVHTDRGACGISAFYRINGRDVRGNCYLFALSPPPCVPGGLVNRMFKSTPGGKCGSQFPDRVTLSPPDTARAELTARILCDNKEYVRAVKQPYTLDTIFEPVPGEAACKKHMFACIFGADDFHFLRRMYTANVLKQLSKLQPLTDAQFAELKEGAKKIKYCWVHQRGWSDAENGTPRTAHRIASGNSPVGFGSPSIVDASGKICWTPFPEGAVIKRHYLHASSPAVPREMRINMDYGYLKYTEFAGLYVAHTGKATVYAGNDDLDTAVCHTGRGK